MYDIDSIGGTLKSVKTNNKTKLNEKKTMKRFIRLLKPENNIPVDFIS